MGLIKRIFTVILSIVAIALLFWIIVEIAILIGNHFFDFMDWLNWLFY